MADWRKTMYKISIAVGVIGIIAALIIFTMVNNTIDSLANTAYAAINSTNQTLTSVDSAVTNAEGAINSTDSALNELKGSLSPLGSGLKSAGESLSGVSSFISQFPGGGFVTGSLDGASQSLISSSADIRRADSALEAQETNFKLLRDGVSGIRDEVENSRESLLKAKKSLDESVASMKTVSLLFFIMNASMFIMQILNAYAGLKSIQ